MYVPNVVVRDSLIDPDSPDGAALVRNSHSERPLYRVFLYLDGLGLSFVTGVTYVLHPSFKEPTRAVFRSLANPRCKLEIWTWGLFRVQAIITDSQGSMTTLAHDLEYNKEFPDVKFIAA